MKLFLLLVCVVAANALSDHQLWEDFKVKFERNYSNKNEEVKRFEIFQENLRKIEQHNARFDNGEVTFKKGVNMFTDLSHSEYVSMLTYSKAAKPPRPQNVTYMHIPYGALGDVPDSIDWRERNVVTPVKNQLDCGSCWAFSTTGGLEAQNAIKWGNLVSLSEQNLLDCSTAYDNAACDGGTMTRALSYVRDFGINSEETYPYEAKLGQCRYQPQQNILHISGYEMIDQNEDALKYAVATYGPISVAVDFSLAGAYVSGVFNDPACHNDPMELNHGVVVVGYGTDNGVDYWIVKNSWSDGYGEQGYIRMIRNANNQCGIVDDASRGIVI